MKLSDNFYLAEFTQSDTALRLGIKNIPSPNIMGNLKKLADGLERVRTLLGHPITVSSGYRSPTLNRAIGGSENSAHCLGYAADIKCWNFGTPDEMLEKIRASGLQLDQCIAEGNWLHISFAPAMRNQYLRALFDNKGKVTYKAFI
jgi:zinc D-Ala-D-Ala carboxypeptidase